MTLREKLVKYLIIKGYEQEQSPSKKFLKFIKLSAERTIVSTLWVGKNGALRSGLTVSKSISLNPNWKILNDFLSKKGDLK